MGLFSQKICSVCGAKLGIRDLMHIELTDGYLCKKCEDKCSPYLDFDLVNRKWSSLDVKNHYADLECQKEKLNLEFTETDCVFATENGNKTGKKLLSIDKNHGWFTICGTSEIFLLSQVSGVGTFTLTSDDHATDLHFKFEAPRPDMEVPKRGETLISLYVDIVLKGNPYTSKISINVTPDGTPIIEPYQHFLKRVYGTAAEIYDMLSPYFAN